MAMIGQVLGRFGGELMTSATSAPDEIADRPQEVQTMQVNLCRGSLGVYEVCRWFFDMRVVSQHLLRHTRLTILPALFLPDLLLCSISSNGNLNPIQSPSPGDYQPTTHSQYENLLYYRFCLHTIYRHMPFHGNK